MAKQAGIILLTGSLGSLSFYKLKGQDIVRRKGGPDKQSILNKPSLIRTRENMYEFANAAKTGKLIRRAFGTQLNLCSDYNVTSRLTSKLVKIIQTDFINVRGERNVSSGDLSLLKGFEFNTASNLNNILKGQTGSNIDRQAGKSIIKIQSLIANTVLKSSTAATHIKFISACTEIDFQSSEYNTHQNETELIPVDSDVSSDLILENNFTPGTNNIILLVFGISFFQVVNEKIYPLNDNSFNTLTIINISSSY